MIPFTFPPTAAACFAGNPEFAAGLVAHVVRLLEDAGSAMGEAVAQAAYDADGWASEDVQDAVDDLLADRPDAEGLAADLVSLFNDRLEEARTEIGEAAAQAARDPDGWNRDEIRDAVAGLLAAHAEVGEDAA